MPIYIFNQLEMFFERDNLFSTSAGFVAVSATATSNTQFSPSSLVIKITNTSFSTTPSLSSPAGQSSTPYSNSTTPPWQDPISTSSKGLAIGAKVGIGIGVTLGVLLFLVALVIVSLYHRRRRRQRPPGNNNNTDPKSNIHEMITNSNRHELPTNYNIHKTEQENQDGLTTLREITLKPHQEGHELDPSSRSMGPEVQLNWYPSPSELEATPSRNQAEAALSPPGRQDSVFLKPVAPKPEHGDDEGGTRSIPDIVERIRIKKERLWELQELQHLEEIANRYNSDNVRTTGGEGIGSGTG
jgi:hypothetical protein